MTLFSELHQRTASLKAQGIPLMSLQGEPNGHVPSSSSSYSHQLQSRYSLEPVNEAPIAEFETVPMDSKRENNAAESELPHPVTQMTSNSTSYSANSKTESQHEPLTRWSNILTRLKGDIDPDQATASLVGYCFMTGFIDSVSFSAIYVWCGFQTGNGTQLAMALARLFEGPPGQRDTTFHNADQLALTSLISFILGASIARIGDKIGAKSRIWLILGTFIQALFTMSAALTIWKSGEPSVADNRGDPIWTNALSFICIVFMSASLGLQGIMAKRVNTQFTTTIVLTTTWVELMVDPNLFRRGYTVSRDHKIMAISVLFFGGFVGRCLVDQIGSAGTLGVGTGLRTLIALSWYLVPGKKSIKA